MKMEDIIQLDILIAEQETRDILIAILSDHRYYAFQESDKKLHAFIPQIDFDEGELREIFKNYSFAYSFSLVKKRNWNALWESEFEPVYLNDFLTIRAHFHPPSLTVQHDIIITPKMSFGTAHHPTTYLMLEAMRNIDFSEKVVMDFGTGTGILAILAEKLGAKSVLAIDNDEWSIQNAKENIIVNKCKRIEVLKSDSPAGSVKYDIILSNINLNVILDNVNALVLSGVHGTKLILSGFMEPDLEIMESTFSKFHSGIEHSRMKDSWLCLQLCLD